MRSGGLRIAIYSNDHRPAHVHVIGTEGEAVFILHCPEGPPELRENYGFKRIQLSRIEGLVTGAVPALCIEWSVLHGNH